MKTIRCYLLLLLAMFGMAAQADTVNLTFSNPTASSATISLDNTAVITSATFGSVGSTISTSVTNALAFATARNAEVTFTYTLNGVKGKKITSVAYTAKVVSSTGGTITNNLYRNTFTYTLTDQANTASSKTLSNTASTVTYNYTSAAVETSDTKTLSLKAMTTTRTSSGTAYLCITNIAVSYEIPTYTVSGKVSDTGGTALSGATITMGANSATSASDGTYSFTGVYAGNYTLTASKDGYVASSQSVAVTTANVTNVNFSLEAVSASSISEYAGTGKLIALRDVGGTSFPQEGAPYLLKVKNYSLYWDITGAEGTISKLSSTSTDKYVYFEKSANGFKIKNAAGAYLKWKDDNGGNKSWNTWIGGTGTDSEWIVATPSETTITLTNYSTQSTNNENNKLGVSETLAANINVYQDKSTALEFEWTKMGEGKTYYFNGAANKTSTPNYYAVESAAANCPEGFLLKNVATGEYVCTPTTVPGTSAKVNITSTSTPAVFYAVDVQKTNTTGTTTCTYKGATKTISTYCSAYSSAANHVVRFVTFADNGTQIWLNSNTVGEAVPSSYSGANVRDASSVWLLDTKLSYMVSGKVTNANTSAAIAGATVKLTGAVTIETTTDASGNYSFSYLPEGEYTISASAEDYRKQEVALNVNSDKTQNFALTPLSYYTLSGKVSSAIDGTVIAGATVKIVDGTTQTTTTAADGSYSFAKVAEDTYKLTVSAEGYITHTSTLVMTGNTVKNVSLRTLGSATRCLIRSTEYSTDKEPVLTTESAHPNSGDPETYLTYMKSLITTVKEGLSYYAIWDIVDNGDGTYTIANVGMRDVLGAGKLVDSIDEPDDVNEGHLYYDNTLACGFEVGTPTSENAGKLKIIPASTYAVTSGEVTNDNYYLITCDEDKFMYTDGYKRYFVACGENKTGSNPDTYNVPYQEALGGSTSWVSDHMVKGATLTTNTKGHYCMWELLELTPEMEATIFSTTIENLTGNVGGVLTLSNVKGITCLENLSNYINTKVSEIRGGGSARKGGEYMHEVLRQIKNIKNDPEDGKYYQELYADQPFFIENMCGTRPSFGSRLTQTTHAYVWETSSSSLTPIFMTAEAEQITANTSAGLFFAEDTGTKVDGLSVYRLKNGDSKYWKAAPANGLWGNKMYVTKGIVTTTTTASEAMKFVLEPVIPGVWLIKDVSSTTVTNTVNGTAYTYKSDSNPYLTLSVLEDGKYELQHYQPEISAMWRFKTYNTLSLTINPFTNTVSGGNGDCVTTFCQGMNYQLDAMRKLQPYYVPATYVEGGKTKAGVTISGNSMSIHLQALTASTVDGYESFLLQYGQGYVLRFEPPGYETMTATQMKDKIDEMFASDYHMNGALAIPMITFFFGTIDATHNSAFDMESKGNMLKGTLTPYLVDTYQKYHDTYVLAYKSSTQQVGTWNYQPVYGIGTGFYHLKIGQSVPANKAYLSMASFFGGETGTETRAEQESAEDEDCTEPVVVTLHFHNAEGVETSIEEVTLDDERIVATGIIRDLQGRKVMNPVKGQVYIIGGKKVLY